jgi:hypothetical protein
MRKFEQQVSDGIDYMDANFPEWRDKFVIRTFRITSCADCVIGQTFGLIDHEDFVDKLNDLRIYTLAFDYGFDTDDDDYEGLQEEWERQLNG